MNEIEERLRKYISDTGHDYLTIKLTNGVWLIQDFCSSEMRATGTSLNQAVKSLLRLHYRSLVICPQCRHPAKTHKHFGCRVAGCKCSERPEHIMSAK